MKTNFVSLRSVTVVDDEVTLTGTIVLHNDQINFCETVEMFCTYQDLKTLLINESTIFSKVFLRIIQEECDVYDLTKKNSICWKYYPMNGNFKSNFQFVV